MFGGYGAGADQHVRQPGRLLGAHLESLLQVAVGGGDAGLAASARVRTSRW